MNDVIPCTRQGERIGPDSIECFSNHFVGPDFAIRPISICNKPCPFLNKSDIQNVVPLEERVSFKSAVPAFPDEIQVGEVGTILKKMLRRFNFHGCLGCAILASVLDRGGPAWCQINMEWILDEMKKNSARAGVPFSRFVAKRFVNYAIRRAERNRKSGNISS